jgi:hypothetical protein
VVDLLAALRASIDAAKGHQPGNREQAARLTTRPTGERASGAYDADVASMTKNGLRGVRARLAALSRDVDRAPHQWRVHR